MPVPQEEASGAVGWVLSIGTAAGVFAYAVRKLAVAWKADGTSIAQQKAQTAVIEQLHAELIRMSSLNAELTTRVTELHSQVVELNKQLGLLTVEKQALSSEVTRLHDEISRMRGATGDPLL